MLPDDLKTKVALKDLGEVDPAWAGILSPMYDETLVTRYIHDQFLKEAEVYLGKYQSTAYWKGLLQTSQSRFSLAAAEDLRILDLGSGGGNTVFPLLELYPRSQIVASDLSLPLLKALREHLDEHHRGAPCHVMQLNAEELVFENRQFDLVVGGAVLHHLFSPDKTLAECHRVLKSNGVAVFFEPFELGHQIVALIFERLLERDSGSRKRMAQVLPGPVEKLLARLAGLLPSRREVPPEVGHFFKERHREFQIRKGVDKSQPVFRRLDDKWLFTRGFFEDCAERCGYREAVIYPLRESTRPFFDHIRALLRLGLGSDESVLPPWAIDVIAEIDEHFSPEARSELLIEGCVVLKK